MFQVHELDGPLSSAPKFFDQTIHIKTKQKQILFYSYY